MWKKIKGKIEPFTHYNQRQHSPAMYSKCSLYKTRCRILYPHFIGNLYSITFVELLYSFYYPSNSSVNFIRKVLALHTTYQLYLLFFKGVVAYFAWKLFCQFIKMTATVVYGRAKSRNLSISSHIPLKAVFYCKLVYLKSYLILKIVFH